MRSTSLSACSISSIDSLRHCLASVLKPQLSEQPVVQPVLVDRGQFVPQRLVEIFDDLGSPFMGTLRGWHCTLTPAPGSGPAIDG